jgi:hypothetical protein
MTAIPEIVITAALSLHVRFCLRSTFAGGGPITAVMGRFMRFSMM